MSNVVWTPEKGWHDGESVNVSLASFRSHVPFRSHVEWRNADVIQMIDSLRSELRKADWTRESQQLYGLSHVLTYDRDGLIIAESEA